MRIPHTVPRPTIRIHSANPEGVRHSVDMTHGIVCDNPYWDEKMPSRLSELCVEAISNNFHIIALVGGPTVVGKMVPKDADYLMDILPLDLPFPLLATHISDDHFWKRYSKAKWISCDMSKHGEVEWCRYAKERFLAEAIESYTPAQDSLDDLVYLVDLCKEVVVRLQLNQLLPTTDKKSWGSDPSVTELRQIVNDHIDLTSVLTKLPKLEDLTVRFGAKRCGTDFAWRLFDVTANDMRNLNVALEKKKDQLRSLRVARSRLEPNHMVILAEGLLPMSVLAVIDLSHNRLEDKGTEVLAKAIMFMPSVKVLDLTNNGIGCSGAKALAHMLTITVVKMESLNLRLNCIGEAGATSLAVGLSRNKHLLELNLTCNRFGSGGGQDFGRALTHNKTLLSLDLSGNLMGTKAGEALLSGVRQNTTLEFLDLRLCGAGEENVYMGNEVLSQNRDQHRKVKRQEMLADRANRKDQEEDTLVHFVRTKLPKPEKEDARMLRQEKRQEKRRLDRFRRNELRTDAKEYGFRLPKFTAPERKKVREYERQMTKAYVKDIEGADHSKLRALWDAEEDVLTRLGWDDNPYDQEADQDLSRKKASSRILMSIDSKFKPSLVAFQQTSTAEDEVEVEVDSDSSSVGSSEKDKEAPPVAPDSSSTKSGGQQQEATAEANPPEDTEQKSVEAAASDKDQHEPSQGGGGEAH